MAKRHFLPACVVLGLVLQTAPAAADGLLDTTVFKRDDIAAFTKWTGMLSRFSKSEHDPKACPPSRLMPCPERDWHAFLKDLAGKDLQTQLSAVNTRVNFAYYIEDMPNWGVPDYWATPFEFMARDGDCEDYAIAKYLTLKALGVDADHMRIVVVDDLDLGVPHAILTVETGGHVLVLDNQVRQIVDASAVHHYRAIYSINEHSWWLHHPPG